MQFKSYVSYSILYRFKIREMLCCSKKSSVIHIYLIIPLTAIQKKFEQNTKKVFEYYDIQIS